MANFNQNQKSYYRNRPEKKVINLVKIFGNFTDGYSELSNLVPEIKTYGGDTPMFDAVINSIMNVIRENTPSPENSNYPNTMSFSIDAHEVGVRTDGEMAFGWKSFYDKESGEIKYRFRVTFINPSTYRANIIKKMKEENAWEELVIDKNSNGSRSRFWRNVENGDRDRRYYNKREDRPGRKVAEADPPKDESPVNPDIAAQLEGYKSPDDVEGAKEVEVEKHEAEPDPVDAKPVDTQEAPAPQQ